MRGVGQRKPVCLLTTPQIPSYQASEIYNVDGTRLDVRRVIDNTSFNGSDTGNKWIYDSARRSYIADYHDHEGLCRVVITPDIVAAWTTEWCSILVCISVSNMPIVCSAERGGWWPVRPWWSIRHFLFDLDKIQFDGISSSMRTLPTNHRLGRNVFNSMDKKSQASMCTLSA
jgi:hypothetical protein